MLFRSFKENLKEDSQTKNEVKDESFDDNEQKDEKTLYEKVQEHIKKPKKESSRKKSFKKKAKKSVTRASIRGIPQPLMNLIRTRVPMASNNSDAVICFLSYILEDYSYLSEKQMEIANNIESKNPFTSVNSRLNALRDRQADIDKNIDMVLVMTAYFTLRSIGLNDSEMRSVDDTEGKFLNDDIEKFKIGRAHV